MEYSPVLSIATAAAEIAAAIWILSSPGRRKIVYTATLLLFLLAGYQVVEFLVCSIAQNSTFLPRLAFMVIAWLPPVGVMLISSLVTPQKIWLKRYSRILFSAVFLMNIWILFDTAFVSRTVCSVVFSRFFNPLPQLLVYGGLYHLGLMSMLLLPVYSMIHSNDKDTRYKLGQMLFGSITFIVPALVVVLSLESPYGAVPSIMCHFAVLLAFFIVRLTIRERKLGTP